MRKTLLTYWNTASFLTLYANANDWSPADGEVPPAAERPVLDRWALSALHALVRDVNAALEEFDTQRAGRLLATFVDDLSNWYVRRSRRRFWDGDRAALATLHECVETVTLTLAPLVPFVTEQVWQDVVRSVDPDAPDSVHLAAWPELDTTLLDPALDEQVALVRRLVELGRAARADSGVRTRQPLGRLLVGAPGWSDLPDDLRAQVADELNVERVEALDGADAVGLVDLSVKANFRSLGARYGRTTPLVAQAVADADAAAVVEALRADGTWTPPGTDYTVEPGDVVVTETPRTGWSVASDGGETVALDLELTPELRLAGLAREVVRLVQDARKSGGLEVTDRIELWWSADGEPAEALRRHGEGVGHEVLAVRVVEGAPDDAVTGERPSEHSAPDLGLRFWLRRAG